MCELSASSASEVGAEVLELRKAYEGFAGAALERLAALEKQNSDLAARVEALESQKEKKTK